MTDADRLGFEIRKAGDATYVFDNIPGAIPPKPEGVALGDCVTLKFAGNEIKVVVTAVVASFVGVVQSVPPDLSIQLDGLSSHQDITFRDPHIFVVCPSASSITGSALRGGPPEFVPE